MNRLQKSFYERIFKPAFVAGDPAAIGEQTGYAIVMLHELLDLWEIAPGDAVDGMELLRRAYPQSAAASAASGCLHDMRLLHGCWAEALELATSTCSLSMILGLADELGHPRVQPVDVFMWNHGRVTRAAYGLDELFGLLGDELDAFHDLRGISLIQDFWDRLTAELPVAEVVASVRGDVGPHLGDIDIAWSVEKAREFGVTYEPVAFEFYEGRERLITVPRPWPRPESFGLVWRDFLWILVRRAENEARTRAGLRRVGEGLISEMRLLNQLREAFPDEVIDHQVRPTWLVPQSLDMVFAHRGIAVEYQGVQHSRPVEFFGGSAAFEQQQQRDADKRALCETYGVRLIEVFPDYVLSDVVRDVRSLILDGPEQNSAHEAAR